MIKVLLHGCTGKMGHMVEQLINNTDDIQVIAGVGERSPEDQVARTSGYPIYENISDVLEKADVIVDFSHASATLNVLEYVYNKKIPLILCTTGISEDILNKVNSYSKNVPIFKSANMSLGINVIKSMLEKITNILYDSNFDIEIIEKHHNQKVDSPSGTALLLADTLKEQLNNDVKYMYGRGTVMEQLPPSQSKVQDCATSLGEGGFATSPEKRSKSEIGIHAIRGGTIPGEHSVIFAGNDEIIEIKHTALSRKIFAEGAVKAVRFILDKPAGLYSMKDLLS